MVMRLVSILISSLVLFFACDSSTSKVTAPDQLANGPKNGEWISRRTNGTIKTRVNYQNGIKHGASTLFHEDGKSPQLVMPYVNGQRHGTSLKYFENGQLYAETNYQHDKLHGVRKTYYRSGQLKSTITYTHGQPHPDLKEYYQPGNEKQPPSLTYERFGGTLRISVATENCKSPEFFLGKMADDAPFPDIDQLTYLKPTGNEAVIDLSVYTPSYLTLQQLICTCKSSQGNPLVLKKSIDL